MPEKAELICESVDGLHRYRVTRELTKGGQAHVYQGHGPTGDGEGAVTLRIFLPVEPTAADLAGITREEYTAKARRSWTNGDSVLQMLNARGVPNICRWVASFVGHPPRPPDEPPAAEPVPVQVLKFVEGENLQRRLSDWHLAEHPDEPDLDGLRLLRGLADTLRALDALDHVIHQDIKPANIILRPDGTLVLIDFTSARKEADLTHMAYTPGASGPEVERRETPTPAYDVHGFGAVAYYLLVRDHARRNGALNIVPEIAARPALLDHLGRVLADDPARRPQRTDLHHWIDELAVLIPRTGLVSRGVRWDGPAVRDEPITVPTPVVAEPEAFPFRAIGDLRAAMAARTPVSAAAGAALPVVALAKTPGDWLAPSRPSTPRRPEPWVGVWSPEPPPSPAPSPAPSPPPVPHRPPRTVTEPGPAPAGGRPPSGATGVLRRMTLGGELTAISGGIALLTWLAWLISGSAHDRVAAVASFVTFTGLAAAAIAVMQVVGARAAKRWQSLPRRISYHRALHVPSMLIFICAAVLYFWLI